MSILQSELAPELSDERTAAPPPSIASTYGARVVRNLGAGAASYAINILVQVVSVPVFLHFWGKELYGEWLLLMAVPIYFAMSDIGFGNVAGTEMTMLVAAGDRPQALKVFQSTWMLITGISLALFLLTAAVLPAVDVRPFFKIVHLTQTEVILTALLLTAYVLVGQQTSLLWAGYRSEGRYVLGEMWSNFARFTEFAALAVGVAAGASVVAAASIMLAVRTVVTVMMRLKLRQFAPWLTYGRKHAELAIVRRLTSPAVSFMAFPLGNALRIQGILIVIGNILGPIAVVSFSTTRTLTNLAFQAMSIVHLAVWPELSAAFGAKDLEAARKLHRRACHAAFWLAATAVVGLLCAGRWVYVAWTHGQVAFDYYLFYTLLLVIVANSLWYASSAVPMATNSHQRTAGCYLLGACIAVVAAWLLVRPLGPAGAGLSLLAIDVLMLANVVPHSLRSVHDTWGGYVRSVLALPSPHMLRAAFRAFLPARQTAVGPAAVEEQRT